jgi:hypothetical protein
METESSFTHSPVPPPVPILSYIVPVHIPHPTSWRSILILSSHLRLGLPNGLFPSGFPTKNLYTTLLSPIRATCLPIPFFWILSPEQYWVKSTDYSSPRYAASSTPRGPPVNDSPHSVSIHIYLTCTKYAGCSLNTAHCSLQRQPKTSNTLSSSVILASIRVRHT